MSITTAAFALFLIAIVSAQVFTNQKPIGVIQQIENQLNQGSSVKPTGVKTTGYYSIKELNGRKIDQTIKVRMLQGFNVQVSGCNNIIGRYSKEQNSFSVRVSSKARGCQGGYDQEIVAALQNTANLNRNGGPRAQIRFADAENNVLMTLAPILKQNIRSDSQWDVEEQWPIQDDIQADEYLDIQNLD